jgi:hypothetical protein
MKLEMSNIIKEDSQEIEVIKETEGQKVGANWISGTKKHYLVDAAVFYLSPEELRNYEGGKYTTQDIVIEAVEGYEMTNKSTGQVEDVKIEQEDKVLYDGKTFKVDEVNNLTVHSDYYEYVAKKEVVDND